MDILPGVEQIEIVYLLLQETEKELETTREEKKSIETQLRDELTEEKSKLVEELNASNEKIKLLSSEVDSLKIFSTLVTTTSGTSGTSGLSYIPGMGDSKNYLKFALDSALRSALRRARCKNVEKNLKEVSQRKKPVYAMSAKMNNKMGVESDI